MLYKHVFSRKIRMDFVIENFMPPPVEILEQENEDNQVDKVAYLYFY